MDHTHKATRINLFSLATPQMRTFHMTWFAFFLCFFAWFGIAPLMEVVGKELHFDKSHIKWCMIASVAITVLVRLIIGWVCDRIGPRLAYTWLLVLGSLPVMGIAFAYDFTSFIIFLILIGGIGASFVITQYHTSVMFAPNVVGTANATTAGWGNLGGGVTQFVMPLLFALFVGGIGLSSAFGWRACMVAAGVVCLLTGVAYYVFTQDSPEGNFKDLRAAGMMPEAKKVNGAFLLACRDYRVWMLFLLYGACFGIELTINRMAAQYFARPEYGFGLSLTAAGFAAAAFGLMNIFARTLGGVVGDKFAARFGLHGRVRWLFIAIFCEGLALMLFSQMRVIWLAIPSLILFSLFVQMAEGATFSVVPFINKKALGSVAGIVGAGGNAGAVAAGFLFGWDWTVALLTLGGAVTGVSFLALTVQFSTAHVKEADEALAAAVAARQAEFVGAT